MSPAIRGSVPAAVMSVPPYVASQRVEAELGGNHFVPLRLKSREQFAEARAVGPQSVDEHDAWLCLL